MKCKQFRITMVDLDTQNMNETQRRHLSSCDQCAEWLELAVHVRNLVALKRYEQPPAAFEEKLIQDVARAIRLSKMEDSRRETPFFRYATATAFVLLAFLYGAHLGPITPLDSNPEPLISQVATATPAPEKPAVEHPLVAPRLIIVEPVRDLTPSIPYGLGAQMASASNRSQDQLTYGHGPVRTVSYTY